MFRDWFVYGTDAITFAGAGATVPVNIAVQADSDFVLCYLTFTSSDAAGFFLRITDQGSNRALSNVQIPVASLCGTGSLPYVLPQPHKFARAGSILLDTTNAAAGANTGRVALHGYKVFVSEARL